MKELKFVKLSNKWFVDIPYDGNINDLQMVDGADTFLDCYNSRNGIVEIGIFEQNDKPRVSHKTAFLKKISTDEFGATYSVDSEKYRGNIWLCEITKLVFGEYPDEILVCL